MKRPTWRHESQIKKTDNEACYISQTAIHDPLEILTLNLSTENINLNSLDRNFATFGRACIMRNILLIQQERQFQRLETY